MLENAPSLKDYKRGLPSKPPAPSSARWRVLVMLVGALMLLLAIIGVNVARSDRMAYFTGTGTVTGVVIDENGKPIQVQVFVLKTNIAIQTDSTGAFQVSGVPAGQGSIVVARDGAGNEFPVAVVAGSMTDLGQIKFVGTRVPGQ